MPFRGIHSGFTFPRSLFYAGMHICVLRYAVELVTIQCQHKAPVLVCLWVRSGAAADNKVLSGFLYVLSLFSIFFVVLFVQLSFLLMLVLLLERHPFHLVPLLLSRWLRVVALLCPHSPCLCHISVV